MEKLIYVLIDTQDQTGGLYDRFDSQLIPEIRRAGGENITLLLSDMTAIQQTENPARLIGDFSKISAVVEFWLPSVDLRMDIEARLSSLAGTCWGYLVSESTIAACPHQVADGEKVPGVTQFCINDKPKNVTLDDFYREWAVHSTISFGLHPERVSYIRNAVFRPLVHGSPDYLGIVYERFPSIELFVNDELYFGDPVVVQEMFDHLPTFFEGETAISGGMSEYRWA
ncbi:MAG: hypothetical protein ACON4J_05445 [Parvibaculales bacterium]